MIARSTWSLLLLVLLNWLPSGPFGPSPGTNVDPAGDSSARPTVDRPAADRLELDPACDVEPPPAIPRPLRVVTATIAEASRTHDADTSPRRSRAPPAR